MQQIADWLEKLGMPEYVQCFADNKIDVSVLRHLTDQDLKDIGIPLGQAEDAGRDHQNDRHGKQAPTKLGLQAGQTITVEAAIKSMVTKSANDAAVVVAENLGGDEGNFAKLMTRGPAPWDNLHDLYERLGPARRRSGHHGPRSGVARPRHPGALPALLQVFLHQ